MSVGFITVLLLIGCYEVTGNTCESMLPKGLDLSICDEIQSVVFTLRYAVQDIDEKVKETVVVSLKETNKILNSTITTTLEDVRNELLAGTRTKRSTAAALSIGVRDVAQKAVEGIQKAVQVARKKIRSLIGLAVSNTDVQNDKIKTEALYMLRKIFTKRSTSEDSNVRRNVHQGVQNALSSASDEIKKAMKEVVTTSIQQFGTIMDYFTPSLKELFKQSNIDADVDNVEQHIEKLSVAASVNFIKFYDSFSKFAVGKAIESIEGLLTKAHKLAEKDPNVLATLKSVLESQSRYVSEAIISSNNEPDLEIKTLVFKAANRMVEDFKSIEEIIIKT